MCSIRIVLGLVASVLVLAVNSRAAGIISINAAGSAPAMGLAEVAGAVPFGLPNAHVAGWITNPTGLIGEGSATPVTDHTGSIVSNVQFQMPTGGTNNGSGNTTPGDFRMMNGYWESTRVLIRGLTPAYTDLGFWLVVYSDGNNGSEPRAADMQLYVGGPGGGALLTSNTANDPANSTFNGTYILGTNYTILTVPHSMAILGTTYNITNTGVNPYGGYGFDLVSSPIPGPSTPNPRAAINGFQLIAMPEPTTLGLLALGGMGLLSRRRR